MQSTSLLVKIRNRRFLSLGSIFKKIMFVKTTELLFIYWSYKLVIIEHSIRMNMFSSHLKSLLLHAYGALTPTSVNQSKINVLILLLYYFCYFHYPPVSKASREVANFFFFILLPATVDLYCIRL